MSQRRLPLHWRVMLAYTALGATLSVLFAGATLYIAEDYEEVVSTESLRGLAEDFGESLQHMLVSALPRSRHLTVYLQRPGQAASVPVALAALPPGIHELEHEGRIGVHVGVFDVPAGRLYLQIDLQQIERLEAHLDRYLVAIIALGITLSAWLGWLLARSTIAPVRKLAAAVAELDVRPAPTHLTAGMPADDLAKLAGAIDHYQARLVEASARESAFFADASHELRTPIAIVRGTAELLLDEAWPDPTMREPLQRLDRGMHQLTDLLDVLLGLARRQHPTTEPMDPLHLLVESLDSLNSAECGPAVQIEIHADPDAAARGTVQIRRHASLLLLRCLVRSLLSAEAAGVLRLRRTAVGFVLSFADATGLAAEGWATPCERSDAGRGLTLVGRLAQNLGWSVTASTAAACRVLTIILPPDLQA